MLDTLPILLPPSAHPRQPASDSDWRPTRHLQPPQPPPPDEHRQDIARAAARELVDGKALKKTRPRRTVDYGGSMGRWILVCALQLQSLGHTLMLKLFLTCRDWQNQKTRPTPYYVPSIRPAPPFIINVRPFASMNSCQEKLICCLAAPAKSLLRQSFYFPDHEVHPYINEQNSLPC